MPPLVPILCFKHYTEWFLDAIWFLFPVTLTNNEIRQDTYYYYYYYCRRHVGGGAHWNDKEYHEGTRVRVYRLYTDVPRITYYTQVYNIMGERWTSVPHAVTGVEWVVCTYIDGCTCVRATSSCYVNRWAGG